MTSRYSLHVEKWSKGCGASICSGVRRKCFARGTIPCDILFCGESPGVTEDSLGRPFCGPAGHLLDQIIAASVPTTLTYALTNLVLCMPNEGGKKSGEPDHNDILCCQPRLQEFLAIADPSLIVCVGKLSTNYFTQGYKHAVKTDVPTVDIIHPAAILRAPSAMQPVVIRKAIVTLQNACHTLMEEK